jgi:transcriptional regulator GlxA family with amidase domain
MPTFDEIGPFCREVAMSASDAGDETIGVVAFDGIDPFQLSLPSLVFGADRRALGIPRARVLVGAQAPGRLTTAAGFDIEVAHGAAELAAVDMLIVPSWTGPDDPPSRGIVDLVAAAHARGATVVGLCLGSFVLAAAGILDGRRATTHWAAAEILAARHPAIRVDADVLYVDEGDVVTSAGVAAALDCCLHLLRKRHGAEIAARVARRLVVPPHRQGGQAQYVERPLRNGPEVDRLARLLDEIAAHPEQQWSLDTAADRASMSRRSFVRRVRATTGASFGDWLRQRRIDRAQHLLETTDLSIEAVAEAAGFGSAPTLRQVFAAEIATTPSRWRAEFGTRTAAPRAAVADR